jgi:hypothetical protein
MPVLMKCILAVVVFELCSAFTAITLCLIPWSEVLPFQLELLAILVGGGCGAWKAVAYWQRISDSILAEFRLFIGLTAFLLFPLLLVGIPYTVLMHTSWPLRTASRVFEGVRIRGIEGSISSGVRIRSIAWNDSEISDIRLFYNNIFEIYRRRELIIHEFHIGKAHVSVDFSGLTDNVQFGKEAEEAMRLADEQEHARSAATAQTAGAENLPLRLFRIDRMELADIALRNVETEQITSIPSIVWTDFKAGPGMLEIGDLSADSDALRIVTKPLDVDGYERRVEVLFLPPFHPSLLRPVPLAVNFGHTADTLRYAIEAFNGGLTMQAVQGLGDQRSGVIRCHDLDLRSYFNELDNLIGKEFSARLPLRRPWNLEMVFDAPGGEMSSADFFDKRVTLERTSDNTRLVQCRDLDLGEYFEGTLPESLTFEAIVTEHPDRSLSLDMLNGSFRLGQRSFEIAPHSIAVPVAGMPPERWTLANSSDGDRNIRYDITVETNSGDALPNDFLLLSQELLTDPASDLLTILAEIYYGKRIADLDADELSDLDRRSGSFASVPNRTTPDDQSPVQ